MAVPVADLSPEAEDFVRQIRAELEQSAGLAREIRQDGGGPFYIRVSVPGGLARPVAARVFREIPVEREKAQGVVRFPLTQHRR